MNSPEPFSVSVVIPAYNAEQFVSRAIKSVLAQTHKPDEIIVIDDGSTDQTAERVKHYKADVRYIFQPNAGVSQARNAGIKAANSEWIAFLDSDDEWLPEKLESQLGLLKRNPDLVWASCNYIFISCPNDKQWPYIDPEKCQQLMETKEYFHNFLVALCHGVGWNPVSMIIKRHAIEQAGFFKEKVTYGEDIDLWLRISYRWCKFGFVNHPMALYYYSIPGSCTQEMAEHEKWNWDFDLYDRHLDLSAQYGQEIYLKNFIRPRLLKVLLTLYLNNQFGDLRHLLSRYKKVFSLRCKWILRLLTLPMMPNNAHTRNIVRKLLEPGRVEG